MPEKMVKLICKKEHRIYDSENTLKEKYEDDFGEVYEVSEKKAKELLSTGKFEQVG